MSEANGNGDRRVVAVVEQRFTYEYDRPVSRLDHRLIVVPPARHGGQRRLGFRLAATLDGVTIGWSRDAFGNMVARLRAGRVPRGIDMEVEVSVERPVAVAPIHLHPDARHDPLLLRPTALTGAEGAVARLASELVEATPLATAERVCAHVHAAIAYDFGATTVGTTGAEALEIGRGVCQDHAHAMLAICRAAGLAARYVSGHLPQEGGTHAWVEVLVEDPDRPGGTVAVPLDPSTGRRAGAGHITVAVGRDYRDVAPTSGTYEGPHAGRLVTWKRIREHEALAA